MDLPVLMISKSQKYSRIFWPWQMPGAKALLIFFWDFWKNQVEKINTFNDRLTGLNITINQETKILNNKF